MFHHIISDFFFLILYINACLFEKAATDLNTDRQILVLYKILIFLAFIEYFIFTYN